MITIAYKKSTNKPIIEIDDNFKFCDPPKISVIVGKNGSGKSTLLRHFYQDTSCVYLPEELELPAEMKTTQILKLFGIKSIPKEQKEEIQKIETQEQEFKKLSKGNKQKLRLKCVLIQACQRKKGMLFLDEPFSGLDKPSRAQTEETVAAIAETLPEMKIVVITHEPWNTSVGETISIEDGKIYSK